ncbi:MAG: hypothetical protein WB626_04055 [Bacteroidota bacterium]
MKQPFLFAAAALAAVLLILPGCSKDETTAPVTDPEDQLYGSAQTDQQFFQLFAQNDEFFATDDITMDDGEQPLPMGDDILPRALTPIHPFRWARFIRTFSRNVSLDSVTVDSLAYLRITKTWEGTLFIAASYSDTATTPDTVIRKPFSTTSQKRFIFKRIGAGAVIWRNWRRIAVSLVAGGTTGGTDIALNALTLVVDRNGSRDSVTVTDPLATFRRFRILNQPQPNPVLEIDGGREVTVRVTLTSADPDTDIVLLRYGYTPDRLHRHRVRMFLREQTLNGSTWTRVYERAFLMHFRRGVFTATVDAHTHSTLFDDQAAVACSFWGMPYRVLQ